MASSAQNLLRRKHLGLGTGEIASAGVFLFVALRVSLSAAPHEILVGITFLPLVAILAGVGCYWLLARRWIGSSGMPASFAILSAKLRFAYIALLLLGLLALLLMIPMVSRSHAILGGSALAFALVEHINYFHFRLAYPMRYWLSEVGRLRIPRLRKDIQKGLGIPHGHAA